MGVPKFYRWISERYPCLSETVKEYQIPEFDNLYLDMNGIIHTCSHPNDEDIHFRISEEKIVSDIFHYLEVLFRLIRPQKVFFMAIDGVAPRAKMNQQRGRRFRSAKEAEDKEKEALRKGEVLPEEKRFDSNCITPGTEFMDSLQKQLEFFVAMKISSDPLWQKTQVILSGHQVPGEGEHKIMEFIRFQRSQPDYNAETRHCLYGLDADLMMLGLCSHEPYFSLLREEVKFGGKKTDKRISTPEETTFHLLHLSLFREYLDLEFALMKTKLKFPYDLEHIIDDWVLMGFLVGNDFIPHLPHFHINKGALPMLYSAYMDVLPTLDGYINEDGLLNLPRFEKFMERLAQIDYDHFNDIYADVKWLESRHGRKKLVEYDCEVKAVAPVRTSDTTNFLLAKAAEVEDLLRDDSGDSDEVDVKVKETGFPVKESETDPEFDEEDDDEDGESYVSDEDDYSSSDEEKQFQAEFKAHKRNYYIEKLEYSEVDGDVLRNQAEGYVLAIQWILHYYYNGVCSWSWYYPHHYAPYVSDIRNFANLELKFDLGKPFLPYEQLLGVLPAGSKALLPAAHHSLMSSVDSPIIDFYPSDFQTDKNGKQQEWEAVVLIPFIDEKRLISAMKDCESRLTSSEKKRNQHGPMQVYVFTEQDLGERHAPAYFPPVIHNHCQCTELTRDAFVFPPDRLVKGLHPRYNPERYIPGFPSTRHLPLKGTLKKSSICVFHMNTLNESQILTLVQDTVPDVEDVGGRYCGQTIFVSWPHLQEARVVAVANNEVKYSFEIDSTGEDGGVYSKVDGAIRKSAMTKRDVDEWLLQEKEIRTRYANRWGVDIGKTHILVYATPITGRKYVYTQNGRVTLEKQWSPTPVPFALQATVKELLVKETFSHQYSTLSEVFLTNSVCFMLGHPGYGLKGRVLSADRNLKGKIRIEFENIHEPDNEEAQKRFSNVSSHYMPGYIGAQRLGISPHLISRITGTIYLVLSPTDDDRSGDRPRRPKKINVGLSLKFNKSNEEVPGWSKRGETGWLYSVKTIEVLRRYIQEFPDFFDFLAKSSGSDDFTDQQVFGPDGTERAQQLHEFVQTLPCINAERRSCGATALDSDTIAFLVKQGEPKSMKLKPLVMQVRPHLLYKHDLVSGSIPPDPSANYNLLDRVVNVRQGFSVPSGLRGTVIGIRNASKLLDVVYEILFDQDFPGGLPLRGIPEATSRVYHLPVWAMINLSHGKRQHMERERQGKPTAVVRPSGSAFSKPSQSSEAARNPPRQNHSSYKASLESQPAQAKPVVQPKLLTRKKENSPGAAALPNKSASSGNRNPTKSAPSPSSLPSPFMDIWNSLVQQHEQQQQQQQGVLPTSQIITPQEPSKPQQQRQSKSKTKEQPIPTAPRLPSLQEAARNLPKITKLPRAPSGAPQSPLAHVTPIPSMPTPTHPAEVILQAVPPPPIPGHVSMPVGPSLSVQQLFDMASQAAFPTPIMPRQPPPAVFGFCLQLMDIVQQKGMGLPVYNYLMIQDGSIMAEVSVIGLGVVGRCAAQTKDEAAELAASMALRSSVIHRIVGAPAVIPGNMMFAPHPHPPGMQFGAIRGTAPPVNVPVPNSFVPMQVTRQSVQQQPRTHQAHPPTDSSKKNEPKDMQQRLEEQSTFPSGEQELSGPESLSADLGRAQNQDRPVSSSKPPGSRLAIRFNGP